MKTLFLILAIAAATDQAAGKAIENRHSGRLVPVQIWSCRPAGEGYYLVRIKRGHRISPEILFSKTDFKKNLVDLERWYQANGIPKNLSNGVIYYEAF